MPYFFHQEHKNFVNWTYLGNSISAAIINLIKDPMKWFSIVNFETQIEYAFYIFSPFIWFYHPKKLFCLAGLFPMYFAHLISSSHWLRCFLAYYQTPFYVCLMATAIEGCKMWQKYRKIMILSCLISAYFAIKLLYDKLDSRFLKGMI